MKIIINSGIGVISLLFFLKGWVYY